MVQGQAVFVQCMIVPMRNGRLRFLTALLAVVVVEYSGWRLLGASGCGIMLPVFQRLLSSARPGQCGELRVPQIDADGPHWRLDGAALRQFWQMPWAICLCVTGNRPQWLFYNEVERGVFVQCCREAHLALHTASVEQPTSF